MSVSVNLLRPFVSLRRRKKYSLGALLTPSNHHISASLTLKPLAEIIKTSVTWKHESLGHAYLIVNRQGDVVERKSYTGSDAVNHFISHLSDTWRNIKATAYKYPINMTPGWKTFPQSEAAWTLPSPNQWQAETTKASRPQSSPEKLHWSILHAM